MSIQVIARFQKTRPTKTKQVPVSQNIPSENITFFLSNIHISIRNIDIPSINIYISTSFKRAISIPLPLLNRVTK